MHPVINEPFFVLLPQSTGESPLNLELIRPIDKQHLVTPWYGHRQMAHHLSREGYCVGRKRIGRLMRLMGLATIYQKPNTSKAHPEHTISPYLMHGMAITSPNQVGCAVITYIPMRRGFLYLVVIMDWHSRKIFSWRLSNTVDADFFCVAALEEAVARHGKPQIFNTDQGSKVRQGLTDWISFYNSHRQHSSLDGRTPDEAYCNLPLPGYTGTGFKKAV